MNKVLARMLVNSILPCDKWNEFRYSKYNTKFNFFSDGIAHIFQHPSYKLSHIKTIPIVGFFFYQFNDLLNFRFLLNLCRSVHMCGVLY